MKIIREKKFYGFRWQDADEYIAYVILENGVGLLVRSDGTADAADGTRYYHVAREVASTPLSPDLPWMTDEPDPQPKDTRLEDLGWTTEAGAPVFYPLDADEPIESTILVETISRAKPSDA